MKGLALALILVSQAALAEVMIRVRPHVVVVPNSAVKLSQLVDAQGISDTARAQLGDVALSLAPEEGERQEISNAGLTSVLRPIVQAERMRTNQQVHLVVPKTVIIDTVKRDIDADDVKAELLQAWQPLCADCRLEIEGLSVPRVEEIRDWTLKIAGDLPRGSFSIPVNVIKQNGAPLAAWVSGRLLLKKNVPVAKRLLNAGERIESKDIAWEYRDTSYASDGIPSEEEITGRKAKQGLRAGDILWKSLIEKDKAIQRGDMVTVKAAEGSWVVSMSLIAQQDAYVGDVVNLKHPKTNARLVGQVIGQGEVELR